MSFCNLSRKANCFGAELNRLLTISSSFILFLEPPPHLPVDAIDAGALMVAAQQEEVLRVLDLVGQQQAYRLQGLLAAIDIVAQEQVV